MAVARVVMFEGVDGDRVEGLRRRIEDEGRPDGVPATEIVVLHDPDGRRSISILFFESDEDYATADETLNAEDEGERIGDAVAGDDQLQHRRAWMQVGVDGGQGDVDDEEVGDREERAEQHRRETDG